MGRARVSGKSVDMEALGDLCTPWSLRVVATLGIAECIAAGTSRIDDLAAAPECDQEMLGRLLRHLVSKGVFDEPEPGRFALNPAAEALLQPGFRLYLDLDGIGGRMARAWGTLLELVRTGEPAYHQVFGKPFWEDLVAHPELAASFDALMGVVGHGVPQVPSITGGWESVRRVVDVGGGTGAMLAEVLRAHPHLRGTLVDLPGTVARAGEVFDAAGVSDRVAVVGQSFFDPLPSGADVYLLMKVLNDWDADGTTAILRRCAEAARPDGRVIVSGVVVPDGERQGLSPETILVGGRSDTLSEFREIAQSVGLDVEPVEQPSGRFVVECRFI